MICMSHGQLPDFEVFSQAFQRECEDGVYSVKNYRHFEGDYTVFELYDVVKDACAHSDVEELNEFASLALYTLGIEWV